MEQNYFVYKLYNSDCTEFYIGSTKNIKRRKIEHKSNCTNVKSEKYNMTLYEYIRSHGGYSSWNYEILEHIRNSINVVELRNIERKYIEQLKPGLNIEMPNRTTREYRQDNKEYYKEYNKQYREDNKERLDEQKRQWYQDNKEAVKHRVKQYREDNKARLKQKFNCESGGKYTKESESKHMKTKKHQNFIN